MAEGVVTGSLAQVARQRSEGIAAAWLGVTHVCVVDCSASMDERDSRGGRRRIDVAREELAQLQAEHPGAIALLCFSGWARWIPGGVPPEPDSHTDLAGALRFARTVDAPDLAFIVISDGQPDDPNEALEEAREFIGAISTVFVGPEADADARAFLARLARLGRGKSAVAAQALSLADAVRPLLGAPTPSGAGG